LPASPSAEQPKELAGHRPPAHICDVLADEQTSPEQFAIYRRMTPERRLAVAEGLYWTARHLKEAWLHAQHPDWSDAQISREVTRIFRNARA
jgi:hypothetical protein